MNWKEFRKKYELHDFTDPVDHAIGVLVTMRPRKKADYLIELLKSIQRRNPMTKYCPDCGESLELDRDERYQAIYHCSNCHVYWNESLTKKATKWRYGLPIWEEPC